jgi:ribosomal protein S18 acetylase RimI-like enzyme
MVSTPPIVGQIEMGKWRVDPAVGFVNLFYLIPTYRGRGLGGQLHAHAVDFLKQLGYRTARLCVSPTNVRAVRFYQKNG